MEADWTDFRAWRYSARQRRRHPTRGVLGHARIEAPSAWDSNVAPMFLLEALMAAAETATWQETRDRMRALEALFDRNSTFRKFT